MPIYVSDRTEQTVLQDFTFWEMRVTPGEKRTCTKLLTRWGTRWHRWRYIGKDLLACRRKSLLPPLLLMLLPCSGRWFLKVSELQVRNCHPILQQDEENCQLSKVSRYLKTVEPLLWRWGFVPWAYSEEQHRAGGGRITDPEHPAHPVVTLPFPSASLQLHEEGNCQERPFLTAAARRTFCFVNTISWCARCGIFFLEFSVHRKF